MSKLYVRHDGTALEITEAGSGEDLEIAEAGSGEVSGSRTWRWLSQGVEKTWR